MVSALSHRGPDDSGTQIIDFGNVTVGLGHSRLSIQDLSLNGHQPLNSKNQRYAIIYNGEVYNFRELRTELIKTGAQFYSDSDTEVVLNAFIAWGANCVKKFIGMFSFIIVDRLHETVWIFRDRAGVKPLYYYQSDGGFCFASELKALSRNPDFKKELSMEGLSLFLRYGYIPSPHTIFQNTKKLESGCYLKVDLKTLRAEKTRYWNITDYFNLPKIKISESEAIFEIERLLQSACNYRMVSDVPVGLFLSGGYDSTLVASLLQKSISSKLRTFTIGFNDQKHDEAPFAKRIAEFLGTSHTEYYCSEEDAKNIIPLLPKIYDEPFADTSAIPTVLVSKLAKQDVTVALSADGGDEVFGGYTKYTRNVDVLENLFRCRHLIRHPVRLVTPLITNARHHHKWQLLNDCLRADDIRQVARTRIESNYISSEIQKTLINRRIATGVGSAFDDVTSIDLTENQLQDVMMAVDFKTYMVDDILHKVDRASMHYSLEAREPLLDHRVVEYMAQLPASMKIKNGSKKHLIKTIVHKNVPEQLMNRPKKGFGIPFNNWFSDDKNEVFNHFISDEIIKKQGIFNADAVRRLHTDFKKSSNPLTNQRIWSIFIMSQWFAEWM